MTASARFEQLLLPVLDRAYATALRLTRSAPDAEDLVQEAALRAWRAFDSFDPGSNFKAWFVRILTNAYLNQYRKAKREGIPVDLEDTPELYLYTKTAETGLHGRSADPAGALMAELDAEQVSDALAKLPEEYRTVATLYFGLDLSYQDIAAAVGIPIGTVRSRLHRARRILQRLLWNVAVDAGFATRLATGATT
jgi:RNA polymerase sigma-70 factor (ECF subfamily)